MEQKNVVVFDEKTALGAYDEFAAQLQELREYNSSIVFDYSSKEGMKNAKSHIASLRKTKTAIETRRKEKKEAALLYGKVLDSKAKEIKEEIDKMIEVHNRPLREIKEREDRRLKLIESTKLTFEKYTVYNGDIKQLKDAMNDIEKIELTFDVYRDQTEFMEFRRNQILDDLRLKLSHAEKAEKDRIELEQLRMEKEKRDREDAERKRIEEEKARKEREEKERIERERQEKLRKEEQERQAKIAAENARIAEERRKVKEEQDRLARIEREERERIQREQEKIEQEKKRIAEEKRKIEIENAKKVLAKENVITIIERFEGSDEYGARYEIDIIEKDKKLISVGAGPLCLQSEDATLERDLSYVYDIKTAFMLGYEAGRLGKTVECKTEDYPE